MASNTPRTADKEYDKSILYHLCYVGVPTKHTHNMNIVKSIKLYYYVLIHLYTALLQYINALEHNLVRRYFQDFSKLCEGVNQLW